MPYDSQGNYSLPNGTLVSTGDKVLPSQHNPAFNDVASTLSAVLVRDGRAPMTGDLPMGTHKVTGLADGADDTDSATVGQIPAILGTKTGAATEKTTPVDADYTPLYDSAASNALCKLKWSSIKAALKTYFDTLYAPIGLIADLASTAANKGASLVGIEDSGSFITATTVEAALAELAANLKAAQKVYKSDPQVITAAGTLTLAHGLGAAPTRFALSLVCITAEQGYAVGDETPVQLGPVTFSDNQGAAILSDASNIYIKYGRNGSTFSLLSQTSGNSYAIVNTNWKMIVRAWV